VLCCGTTQCAYGLIPEVVGRLPIMVTLDALTEEDLCHVMTEPKHALSRQYAALFNIDGAQFHVTPVRGPASPSGPGERHCTPPSGVLGYPLTCCAGLTLRVLFDALATCSELPAKCLAVRHHRTLEYHQPPQGSSNMLCFGVT
jgi:hypothetical protein